MLRMDFMALVLVVSDSPPTHESNLFLYCEYNNDNLNVDYKLFCKRKDAKTHLSERVKAYYGLAPVDMVFDERFDCDIVTEDFVEIKNDGGDVTHFSIQEININ